MNQRQVLEILQKMKILNLSLIHIYLKLLLLSLKDEGKLYYDGVESDFTKELALTIDEKDDDVMVTINYLINQGLLEVVTENDEYYLTEIPNLIRSETE